MRKTVLLALLVGIGPALAAAQPSPCPTVEWVEEELGVAPFQIKHRVPRPVGCTSANVRLEDLSWLAGSWSGEVKGAAPGTRFETHYTTPHGGVILSSSKALSQEGELRWFEFERFETRDGALQVTPYPNGKASVSFTLVEYDPAAKKAVFANAEHDYPNRITYQRVADDRLLFVVAGDDEGAAVMEFSLSRLP